MRRAIAFSLAAALLLTVMVGCSRQPHDIDFNPGIVYAMSALPFVEGVVLPDTVVANEPFVVRLKLSAALRPELLNGAGLANPLWSNSARFMLAPDPAFAWGDGNLVRIETWFTYERNPDGPTVLDAPPSDEAVFLLALPAGEYELAVSSADTTEYGGMEHRIQVIPTFAPPDNPHASYKTYPLTVHPSPSDS